MKKTYIVIIVIAVLIAVFFIRFILGGSEDDWAKDSKGVWVKHGNPASVPNDVKEQQDAIDCALNLYNEKKAQGMEFLSQCLGTCGDYAVDVVRVPRTNEDNLVENQCDDYRESKVGKFIELDKNKDIVRIV